MLLYLRNILINQYWLFDAFTLKILLHFLTVFVFVALNISYLQLQISASRGL